LTSDALAARCQALRLVLSDVDGVLTDGTLTFLPDGSETKSFHIKDGLGIVLAHRAGLQTGLVSGRSSDLVTRRAQELGMAFVKQGFRDKREALREILLSARLQAHQVAYIGDDLNDLAVFREVGLSAAPADAVYEARAEAFMVTDLRGGHGCLREFIEAILRARGDWERALAGLVLGTS
jgi:3-deoxy-D-manno-octulosonate 8-phosphate phosphatase (KDO 8-P phosphatase)